MRLGRLIAVVAAMATSFGQEGLVVLARLGTVQQIKKVGSGVIGRWTGTEGRGGLVDVGCSGSGRSFLDFIVIMGAAHQRTKKAAGVLGRRCRGQNLMRHRTRHGQAFIIRFGILVLAVVGLDGSMLRLLVVVRIMLLLRLLLLVMLVGILASLLSRSLTAGTTELEKVQQVIAARTVGSHAAGGSRSGRRVLHHRREKRGRRIGVSRLNGGKRLTKGLDGNVEGHPSA